MAERLDNPRVTAKEAEIKKLERRLSRRMRQLEGAKQGLAIDERALREAQSSVDAAKSAVRNLERAIAKNEAEIRTEKRRLVKLKEIAARDRG